MCDAGRFLVALSTRKAPNPTRVGLDDLQSLADLVLADFRPWSLPLEVRAERKAVNLSSQDGPEQLDFVLARHLREIRAEKPRESRYFVTRSSERDGGARPRAHREFFIKRFGHNRSTWAQNARASATA